MSARGAAVDRDAVLRSLSALAREHLGAALETMFGACRSQYFARAGSAASKDEQARCLELVRALSRHRASVIEAFLQRVGGGFERLGTPGAVATGSLRESELPLVELVDDARARFRAELRRTRGSLARVLGATLAEAEDPLDPAWLAFAFLEASGPLAAGREAMVEICQQFDAHLLQGLGPLCRELDQRLDALLPQPAEPPAPASAGQPAPASAPARSGEESEWLDAYFRTGEDTVLSGPSAMSPAAAALFGAGRSMGGASAAASAGAPAQGQADAGMAGGANAAAIGDSLQGLGEISALLQRLRGGAGVPSAAGGALPGTATLLAPLGASGQGPVATMPGEQLVALLGELAAARSTVAASGQATGPVGTDTSDQATASGSPAVAVDIRGALAAIAASRGGIGVARQDQDVLDIVTLFFDTLTEDRALPPAIKGLIARLQLPVLKLALLDRSFFGDRSHPARQLIDAMARAGVGWDASGRETQDSLLAQLGAVVEQLLAGGAPDAGAFGQALARLNEHLVRAEQRAQKLERRTTEKAQAEARTAAARDAVHALLRETLDGRELPQALLDFVTEDWQRVLQLLFLRKGPDSTEWRDAVLLLEELARTSVRPADPAGREALEEALPDLYRRLEAALEMTQGNTGEAQERIGVLRGMHRACVAEPAGAGPAAAAPLARVKIEPPPLLPPRSPRPAAGAPESAGAALTLESLKRVDELPIGTWFEYENPANRATRRLKLSARIEETRVFLFCDHLGHPVAEKPRKQFALELQSGHLRVIEDTPLVDRTIERIAASLRAQAGAA